MSHLIIDALRAKLVAQRLAAVANLQTYLSTAVGVGEHPNIVEECYKLLEIISKCDGEMQSLTALVDQANANSEGRAQ